jgi:hypothetical protein
MFIHRCQTNHNQTGGSLSTFSRPDQVGWWFRIGRRNFQKVPQITSLHTYEQLWIGWWVSLQPDWRKGSWPLPRDSPADGSWDKLFVGGKDGLFIVLMTLSWWITEHTKGEAEDSELDEAITDVSWVFSNLVSALSAGDPGQPFPSSSVPPQGSQLRPQRGMRIGPPRKRSRLHHS